MEENPYKAPAELDTDRNDILASIVRFLSRFQVQYWCWILALVVSVTGLAIFQFVLLVKGVPHGLLVPYFIDATWMLLGLWAFAGVVWKGCWFAMYAQKRRAQRRRLQRLNGRINVRLNTVYMEMLQKHYGKRIDAPNFRVARKI